jgi:glyoxylase-like metal-dependent hydrolase (beta-lactamase superfamily II)
VSALSITWLGHATFLLQTPGGRRILFDPWVTGNPASPESAKKLGALDLILVTHGHSDHVGDAVAIGRCGCGRGVSDSGPSVTFARPDRPNVSYKSPADLGLAGAGRLTGGGRSGTGLTQNEHRQGEVSEKCPSTRPLPVSSTAMRTPLTVSGA